MSEECINSPNAAELKSKVSVHILLCFHYRHHSSDPRLEDDFLLPDFTHFLCFIYVCSSQATPADATLLLSQPTILFRFFREIPLEKQAQISIQFSNDVML